MKLLDRNRPFDTSYGETHHRYLQDGVWFNAQGESTLATDGIEAALVRGKPKAEIIAPLETVVGKKAPVSTPANTQPAVVDYRAQLMAMPTAQVKKIFVQLNGPAELTKGKGAVGKMADWLVAQPAEPTGPTGPTGSPGAVGLTP